MRLHCVCCFCIIALLTLTFTNPYLSPGADLDLNLIPDPHFNVYPNLN